MKNKIQEQVLKEEQKWLKECPNEIAPHLFCMNKAISRTIELMEEQNNHLHSTLHCKLCKSMSVSRIDEND